MWKDRIQAALSRELVPLMECGSLFWVQSVDASLMVVGCPLPFACRPGTCCQTASRSLSSTTWPTSKSSSCTTASTAPRYSNSHPPPPPGHLASSHSSKHAVVALLVNAGTTYSPFGHSTFMFRSRRECRARTGRTLSSAHRLSRSSSPTATLGCGQRRTSKSRASDSHSVSGSRWGDTVGSYTSCVL